MSDAELGHLRRAFEASGSTEDEAAYLRERVRVGDLPLERLHVAAACGHVAAGAITGRPPLDDPTAEALMELGRHGMEWVIWSFTPLLELTAGQAWARASETAKHFLARSLYVNRLCEADLCLETREAAAGFAEELEDWLLAPLGAPTNRSQGLGDLLESLTENAYALAALIDVSPKLDAWDMDDWQTQVCMNGASATARLLELSGAEWGTLRSQVARAALTAPKV